MFEIEVVSEDIVAETINDSYEKKLLGIDLTLIRYDKVNIYYDRTVYKKQQMSVLFKLLKEIDKEKVFVCITENHFKKIENQLEGFDVRFTRYSMDHLFSENSLKKATVVKEWREKYGLIWSRKELYECVSHQLVSDTADTRYEDICDLFRDFRTIELLPYGDFKDKRTSVWNTGIRDEGSFDEQFKIRCRNYTRSSKVFQKYYVEVWSEKDLSDSTDKVLNKYDAGVVTGEGFVGDIPFHDAIVRIQKILKIYEKPIRVVYICDYDSEGDHIFNICKEKLEKLGDVTVEKMLLTGDQVRNGIITKDGKKKDFISNIGYEKRMKGSKHLSKKYVKDFIERNRDLTKSGIIQYELDQFPVDKMNEMLEEKLSQWIDLKIIEETDKRCKKEVAEWLEKHYKE